MHTVNPLVPHFTCPQFAREVLNNFNKKIEDISKIVNVYYYNIDAILIDEHDYYKLKSLGYIGDAMGQYKIEHVFTEIAIMSPKQYVATLDSSFRDPLLARGSFRDPSFTSGTIYKHSVKNVDYSEYVNNVKKLAK